jgi:MFS family permease
VFPVAFVAVPLTPPGTPTWLVIGILVAMEFVAGFGVMVLDVNASAIIPARTPDLIRSRVAGAWRFVNMGIRPIGALVGGFLGGAIGVRETLFATALLQLVGVLFLIGTPVLRLRDVPEEAEH